MKNLCRPEFERIRSAIIANPESSCPACDETAGSSPPHHPVTASAAWQSSATSPQQPSQHLLHLHGGLGVGQRLHARAFDVLLQRQRRQVGFHLGGLGAGGVLMAVVVFVLSNDISKLLPG